MTLIGKRIYYARSDYAGVAAQPCRRRRIDDPQKQTARPG